MSATVATRIRPAAQGDHDRVQALWDAAGMSRASADEWGALMASPTSTVLVAESEGEGDIVGAAIASYDGWRAYIYHAAVRPEQRRMGVGQELLREAEAHLTRAGARNVFVEIDQDNTEALALVGARGYLPGGEIVLTRRL